MDIKRVIFSIVTGILFLGMGFLGGHAIGRLVYTPPEKEDVAEISLVQEVEADTSPSPGPSAAPPLIEPTLPSQSYYLIKATGSSIYLYEVNNNNKSTVKAFDAPIDMLPAEDVSLLRTGIKTASIQEAYSVIENFTS